MNIIDYKRLRQYDIDNKTNNLTVLLVNGTPALRIKQYNPTTGDLLNEEMEVGIDVDALKKQIEFLQDQIDNIEVLIKDTETLMVVK